MKWLRRSSSEPLWKEEFSVRTADERYVTRRQLTKFLVLTSFGMFVGNLWILVRSIFSKAPSYPQQFVAREGDIPIGGVKLFTFPTKDDHCILVRTSENEHVAFSQKCTHLSCAVYYSRENDRLECPCHKGFFSVADGSVLQGPPSRPLPKIALESRDGQLIAVGIKRS
jgi:Rieske Fe-S protein